MPTTVTVDAGLRGRGSMGDVLVRRGTITIGAYATGGVTVTKQQLEFAVDIADIELQPSGGYSFEVLVAADAQSVLIKAYYDNSAGAYTQNQPQGQVTNATNLTAITPRFEAKGH